ncbi:MAG: aldo/keto reductase [Novosphingobium sp.]|nr:aldo/keto reductase [Novosphingobium sp.]
MQMNSCGVRPSLSITARHSLATCSKLFSALNLAAAFSRFHSSGESTTCSIWARAASLRFLASARETAVVGQSDRAPPTTLRTNCTGASERDRDPDAPGMGDVAGAEAPVISETDSRGGTQRNTEARVEQRGAGFGCARHGQVARRIPSCKAWDIALVVGAPYISGILAGRTRTPGAARYDCAPAPQHLLDKVQCIEASRLAAWGHLPAAALAFVLAHPQVVSVIPGLCSAEQVQQTLNYYRMSIPSDFWCELRTEGLLRPDAPVLGDIA